MFSNPTKWARISLHSPLLLADAALWEHLQEQGRGSGAMKVGGTRENTATLGFSWASFRSAVPWGHYYELIICETGLQASLPWRQPSFHLKCFQSLWGERILVYRFREQVELVIWAMKPIYPVLKHKYSKEEALRTVFELPPGILLDIDQSSYCDEGARRKRRESWIGTWEGTEVNKFLMRCPTNKFKILLVGRGENHWHLQHQKSKKNHEGQAEDGNRASGVPRRGEDGGEPCRSQGRPLAEALGRTGRHMGKRGRGRPRLCTRGGWEWRRRGPLQRRKAGAGRGRRPEQRKALKEWAPGFFPSAFRVWGIHSRCCL